ncbi:unnamed protein product, partial [Ectocarpus fasciculatus]
VCIRRRPVQTRTERGRGLVASCFSAETGVQVLEARAGITVGKEPTICTPGDGALRSARRWLQGSFKSLEAGRPRLPQPGWPRVPWPCG